MAGTWKKLARVQKWFREPAKVWGIGGKEHSESRGFDANQGARFLLGPNIPKREKFAKWPQAIPNGHKSYQMAIKYRFQMVIKYTNIFHSKALQNLPKLGFFGLKINHLVTLMPSYYKWLSDLVRISIITPTYHMDAYLHNNIRLSFLPGHWFKQNA
jgi:hypothetical protein